MKLKPNQPKKHNSAFLLTCSVFCFYMLLLAPVSNAQFNFNPIENRDVSYYSYKLKNEWDSIQVNEKLSGVNLIYTYKGKFRDAIMDGFGQLEGNGFIYTGQWKMGKPHGFGHIKNYNSKSRYYEFKGTFEEGHPKEGLFIGSADKGKPHLFYSGEVKLDVNHITRNIIFHGYGTVLRTDRVEWDSYGVPGGFYSGQFYNNAPTGFGITNTIAPNNTDLNNMELCLTIGGRIAHSIEQLPLRSDFFIDYNTTYTQVNNPTLAKLYPLLQATAMFVKIPIDSVTSYTGSMYSQLPYGLGYVEYTDGFRDIGFWMEGNKLNPAEVLQHLLPKPEVLNPVIKEEWDRVLVSKKSKYNPQKKIYEWDWKKKKMLYHAPMNSQGMPDGWGWKVAVNDDDAMAAAGNFNGTLTSKKGIQNAGILHVLVHLEIHKVLYSQLHYFSGKDRQGTEYRTYFSDFTGAYYPVSFTPDKELDERANMPWVSYIDDRYFKESMVVFLKQEKERIKAATAAWNNQPQFWVYKLVIDKRNLADSYLSDGKKEIKGILIRSNELKPNDHVIAADKIKMVSRIFGNYALLHDNTALYFAEHWQVYVVRGYRLETPINKWKCSACNGVGTFANNKTVNVVSGYKEELAQYNSTYKTVKITPVYTQVGSLFSRTPCSACNGKGQEETILTVVEIKK